MKNFFKFFIVFFFPSIAFAVSSQFDMAEYQEALFVEEGTYEQIKDQGGVSVHVYQTPAGEWGYTVITESSGKFTLSSFGPESDSRSFDFSGDRDFLISDYPTDTISNEVL